MDINVDRRHPFAFKPIHVTRDVALFTTGMLGVAHETLVTEADRPGLLVLFAAMMGLPLYFKNGGGK